MPTSRGVGIFEGSQSKYNDLMLATTSLPAASYDAGFAVPCHQVIKAADDTWSWVCNQLVTD